MKVTIKGIPQEMLVYTVGVVPQASNNLYSFHCTNCGQTIAQYQGGVAKIYPFVEPHYTGLTISGCKRCGSRFTFQTLETKKPEFTKVMLYAKPTGKSQFYCHAGHSDLLLLYTGEGVFSLVENKIVTLPYIAPCTNKDCNKIYHFTELV